MDRTTICPLCGSDKSLPIETGNGLHYCQDCDYTFKRQELAS